MTTETADLLVGPLTARSILESRVPDLTDRLGATDAVTSAARRVPGPDDSLRAGAHSQLTKLATNFLDVDVGHVLISGLRTYARLLDAGASTWGSPDSVVVPLSGQDLSLVQHPSVDVMFGHKKLGSVTFELRLHLLVLVLSGVVRDGALVELTSGTCEATVSFGVESDRLAEATRTFDPHLHASLGAGVPLTSVPAQRSV
jgi:hypothetical protein